MAKHPLSIPSKAPAIATPRAPRAPSPSVLGNSQPTAAPAFSPRTPMPNKMAAPNPMVQGSVPWSQQTGTSAREKPEHFNPETPPPTGTPPNG